jgi:Ca2+-binding EF-hand superfamily protein
MEDAGACKCVAGWFDRHVFNPVDEPEQSSVVGEPDEPSARIGIAGLVVEKNQAAEREDEKEQAKKANDAQAKKQAGDQAKKTAQEKAEKEEKAALKAKNDATAHQTKVAEAATQAQANGAAQQAKTEAAQQMKEEAAQQAKKDAAAQQAKKDAAAQQAKKEEAVQQAAQQAKKAEELAKKKAKEAEEEHPELCALFKSLDVDGDGAVSKQELVKGIQRMGDKSGVHLVMGLPAHATTQRKSKALNRFFSSADNDGDSQLDFAEFVAAVKTVGQEAEVGEEQARKEGDETEVEQTVEANQTDELKANEEVKECTSCKQQRARTEYSGKQWQAKSKRRCKRCIGDAGHKKIRLSTLSTIVSAIQ